MAGSLVHLARDFTGIRVSVGIREDGNGAVGSIRGVEADVLVGVDVTVGVEVEVLAGIGGGVK